MLREAQVVLRGSFSMLKSSQMLSEVISRARSEICLDGLPSIFFGILFGALLCCAPLDLLLSYLQRPCSNYTAVRVTFTH